MANLDDSESVGPVVPEFEVANWRRVIERSFEI
jgi:hypothetical protein